MLIQIANNSWAKAEEIRSVTVHQRYVGFGQPHGWFVDISTGDSSHQDHSIQWESEEKALKHAKEIIERVNEIDSLKAKGVITPSQCP